MAARMEWNAFAKLAPGVNASLLAASKETHESGLDSGLLEIVKLRASLLNGCAFCIAYHTTNALKLGVSADRISLLSAWAETPLYSEQERAALLWTDLLTALRPTEHFSDADFDEVHKHFTEVELAHLFAAVALVNAWNRIARAYRFTPSVAE